MKSALLFILLACVCECYSQSYGVMRMTKRYYRSDPFLTKFSDFVDHLVNDPTLKNVQVNKKTDSTLFFFEGDYSKHNPFTFKTDRIHIILAEREEVLDTSLQVKLVYSYQLIAYAEPGKEGLVNIKKQFTQFRRRHYTNFEMEKKHTIDDSSKATGEIMEFFPRGESHFSAFRTAWISTADNKNMFVLTLRFSVDDNWAYIPLPRKKISFTREPFTIFPIEPDGDW